MGNSKSKESADKTHSEDASKGNESHRATLTRRLVRQATSRPASRSTFYRLPNTDEVTGEVTDEETDEETDKETDVERVQSRAPIAEQHVATLSPTRKHTVKRTAQAPSGATQAPSGTTQAPSRTTQAPSGATGSSIVPAASSSRQTTRTTRIRRTPTEDIKRTTLKRSKDDRLIVGAIDFGTTFSGYAFSLRSNPAQIFTHYWEYGGVKTPTVVLLDKHKKLHSFGVKAREQFVNLCDTGDESGWYFFEHFKMRLFSPDTPIHRNMTLEDIEGKELPAMDVFAAAIKYMISHMLQNVNKETLITVRDIHWILTVPAIWSNSSKQFMREAAEHAGIENDLLTLALEPEAASLFCRQNDLSNLTLARGTRYLVMDLGGGTADIVVHEINQDGSLIEVLQATGGAYGGKEVDNQFISILIRIFGAKFLKKFKAANMRVYYELIKDFELKKKTFDGNSSIRMKFPETLLNFFEKEIEMTVSTYLEQSPLHGQIEFKRGKVLIAASLARECFDQTIESINKKADDILEKDPHIDHIILVGGFSESAYLLDVFKRKFSNLILLPKEPSSAVVKGAVMFGYKTTAVVSRVSKYTFGIARMMIFKPYHRRKYRVRHGGMEYCDNLFNKHIEIGQHVRTDETPEAQAYFPSAEGLAHSVLEVYASTAKDPVYVTEDSCRFVGLLRLDHPYYTNEKDWKIMVTLQFGGTELIVEAHEVKTGHVINASVDFLC